MSESDLTLAQARATIEQLRGTLGKLDIALGAIRDSIVWTDQAGRIQWCNATFDRLVGRSRTDILGTTLTELLPVWRQGHGVPAAEHPVAQFMAGAQNLSGCYSASPQETPVLEIVGVRVELGAEDRCVVYVIRDITDTHDTGDKLRAANAALETQLEEVETLNRIMMGREERILELKQEIRWLRSQLAALQGGSQAAENRGHAPQ